MKNAKMFWVLIVYAACLMYFGYFGYIKTGSIVSLYSSLGFGILLLLCSLGIYLKNKFSLHAALALTALLTCVFSYRYAVGQKFIPGMMAAISCVVFLCFAKHIFRRKKGQ